MGGNSEKQDALFGKAIVFLNVLHKSAWPCMPSLNPDCALDFNGNTIGKIIHPPSSCRLEAVFLLKFWPTQNPPKKLKLI
jgi:hypothetical protein